MDPSTTAVVLVGFQRDYFDISGVLHDVVADSAANVLSNTLGLLRATSDTEVLIVSTPIVFTAEYEELVEPVGVLRLVQQRRAFQHGQPGCQPIRELEPFAHRIVELTGKRGLNAFSETSLETALRDRGVVDVVLAGAVTSICIDSTARTAHDLGYRVHVLTDCVASRSPFEHRFFCEEIFPLYAAVVDVPALLRELSIPTAATA
jgi:nicotinamidase-related amidase